jgi:hypothetical protein
MKPNSSIMQPVAQCFPTTGYDPYQGQEGCDIGSREDFMENSIIMKFTSFYLEANDWSNWHMYEFFK